MMPQFDETTVIEDERPALRFSIDELREAGASLGRIQTTVVRPKATFEGLIKRGNELRKRAAQRHRAA